MSVTNRWRQRLPVAGEVEKAFGEFWQSERQEAFDAICADEGLDATSAKEVLDEYHFTGRTPLRERIVAALLVKPKILQRKVIVERVTDRLLGLVSTFDDDVGEI